MEHINLLCQKCLLMSVFQVLYKEEKAMKRIIVLIALSLVIIISITSITSITAISFEQNQYEDENSIIENETLDGNSKALIEQFYNDKSLSTQDKEEMKALFDMPQLFNSSNETKMADSSLKSNIDSYNIVIKYLITIIEENPTDNYICLGIDGYTKEDIVLSFASRNGEILEISEDVANALSIIKSAFSDMGYKLDTIKIKDGYISFDTIDGQYSLMFALDEATSINSIDNKDEKVTAAKAQDNWYHKMSKKQKKENFYFLIAIIYRGTAINNLITAMEKGIITPTTKERMEELEAEKSELSIKIMKEEMSQPKLSREEILYWFYKFRKLNPKKLDHRRSLINNFVNSVFLFEDRMVINFNFKDGTETITFADLEKSALGSDLKVSGAP